MVDWEERAARNALSASRTARRGSRRSDERQRQLARMGNAAWAAGLSLLMLGRRGEPRGSWAADTYRRSWPDAPPGSWGARSGR